MSTFDDVTVQVRRESALTEEVIASFAGSTDDRFRTVMESLVRHLHGFVRDVRLSSAEWDEAIAFLNKAGRITDDHRQEFILLSDVLGVSMMTVGVNSPPRSRATESTVFGPFFVEASPEYERGQDISRGMSGMPCYVHGSVRSVDGAVVPSARIEVWAADDEGFYDVQHADQELAGRGHLFASSAGEYDFWTVQPAAYPIPHDGPVGDLLTAARRSPMRPAHIHFMVSADGYKTLITHIFVAGDPWLDGDAVFGVKSSLIVDFFEHPATSAAPRGRRLDVPWSEAVFEIVLAPVD
ncbi:hydroxyquinol 1,2-dioxygenase [Agreia bicolorata]|uniref:Hydroxyquinol 1,2-dioxygenase n=1 Tax=Agreia bicolorata TaxID=110935 RepID=A0A1T4XMD0_9MICO|nr:dioxygenase [Agreia bicolorata]SKA90553.1 hydroxyquinol 1,2-dioxygenase [Agreia bicolorata]